ncbi:hypothetical protein V498_04581, partial [Pseudogymnoascus sp. VKM F-4517 (FW-2822)]
MWLRYLIPTNVRHGRAATGGEEPHNRPHAAARSAAYPSTPTMTSGRGPFPSSTPQLHQPGTRRNTRRASAPREQAAMRTARRQRPAGNRNHQGDNNPPPPPTAGSILPPSISTPPGPTQLYPSSAPNQSQHPSIPFVDHPVLGLRST